MSHQLNGRIKRLMRGACFAFLSEWARPSPSVATDACILVLRISLTIPMDTTIRLAIVDTKSSLLAKAIQMSPSMHSVVTI